MSAAAMDTASLPASSSPMLQLVPANDTEFVQSSIMNAPSWKGPLNLDDYLEREAHLRKTDLNRHGGITAWILVDTVHPPSQKGTRRILASCETLRKRALVARKDGPAVETISHGIGSVYCPEAYRGRGYAQRMLTELAHILDTWQQREGEKGDFTVLWSDIGKQFYARRGWTVYPSTHISLSPRSDSDRSQHGVSVQLLSPGDLEELCRNDEILLKSAMAKPTSPDVHVRVALIPDVVTMQWHHAREEFLGMKLCKRYPSRKGALAKTTDGRRAWCVWTRTFGATPQENLLNILRLVVEGEEAIGHTSLEAAMNKYDEATETAIAAILEAAQLEASNWGMTSVQVWNPSPLTVTAAKKVEPSSVIVDRDDESLASLRWHGEILPASTRVDWIANEKYAWC
ncbi:MAG: hypothetical protein LQ341_005936 [Variospora aurantia]|nr:MAG: hypothetical protein LQ341_005936 [Variospora aurantia]